MISVAGLCDLCRARLDAVLWSVGRHPSCGPHAPLPDAAYDQLVAHLTDQLGATVAEPTTTKERSA